MYKLNKNSIRYGILKLTLIIPDIESLTRYCFIGVCKEGYRDAPTIATIQNKINF
jgi:hypothetical protein